MRVRRIGLPYVDNIRAISITIAINLVPVFLLHWPNGITYRGVLWDSLACAAITTAIDMWIVYGGLKRMRASGGMPSQVPVSGFMQRLPSNPFALGVLYTVGFGMTAAGINLAILSFFGMRTMAFLPWMVYRLIYATWLSIKIVEFCIFRYVQPDWAAGERAGAEGDTGVKTTDLSQTVKNPLPKISMFGEIYGAVSGNIVMNIIIGSLLGGVWAEANGSVVIAPTTVAGMHITGLVFGFIVGVLITNGIVTAMNANIAATRPEVSETAVTAKPFAWMPVSRGGLICFVCVCVMAFSTVVLPAIMNFFGIPLMNFFQFVVFITVYAALVSRPISGFLILRCVQPDYVRHVLKKTGKS